MESKKFSGKTYHLLKLYSFKRDATKKAQELRAEGKSVRTGIRRLGTAYVHEIWFR